MRTITLMGTAGALLTAAMLFAGPANAIAFVAKSAMTASAEPTALTGKTVCTCTTATGTTGITTDMVSSVLK